MAIQLDLDSIQDMKLADYLKAFRQKTEWKKAKHVIFLVDYKLDGKKTDLAIPFRKPADAKNALKRIKKEKIHLFKKSGLGDIVLQKGPEGMKAKIEMKKGGLASTPELVQKKGAKLFDKLKVALEVLQPGNSTEKNDSTEDAQDETTSSPQESQSQLEVSQSTQAIKTGLKALTNTVVPNIKSKQITPADQQTVEQLKEEIDNFNEFFASAEAALQVKLQKFKDQLDKKLPQIDKIWKKLQQEGDSVDIENIKNRMDTLYQEIQNLSMQLTTTMA